MSEEREERRESVEPQESGRPSRRRFLKLAAGAVMGAYAVGEAAAQNPTVLRPQRPPIKIPPIQPPPSTVAPGLRPQGGEEKPLGPWKDDRQDPDLAPCYGPLIVMERPKYDPTPPGASPWLYANRFFENWNEAAADWFGAGQKAVMRTPNWAWMSTKPLPPGWCAVSTIWNKGREPAYGVMMRALCLAMAKVSATEWQEVCRADLGYVCVNALSPGDYIEVRYPVGTVRDGMKALEEFLLLNDPTCAQWPHVWYFHKCFAFDPIRDPFSVKGPLKAPDPPRGVIGGRHAAGWRWELPAQTQYSARMYSFT